MQEKHAKTIVCIMGPTASGKTQLAVELVKSYPFDIISVDSAMVYREMNIGTAKPDAATLAIAPHRLIDFRDPSEVYSAAHFRDDAVQEINNIFAQRRIPLLVGGTMLYFSALLKGLSQLPSADAEIRKTILAEAEKIGWQGLHERLQQVDPAAAKRIHFNDTQRIQRALEVYELTGKNITAWQNESSTSWADVNVVNIAVSPENRTILHERIEKRFDQMLQDGLVEEVRQLFNRPDLTLETPAMRSVGYRQVWEYLAGQLTYPEMRERGIIATRQLAKRQLTWLRSWPDVQWFASDEGYIENVKQYLTSII